MFEDSSEEHYIKVGRAVITTLIFVVLLIGVPALVILAAKGYLLAEAAVISPFLIIIWFGIYKALEGTRYDR